MSTDFTYGGNQIVISGPIKPNGKDMPSDARTRVDCYADIASIPNPYVGLKITVKVDETNNNKMTDYIVKSLKANSIGVANSLIDEVVRYVDYLGVGSSSGGGSGEGTGAGLTSEQVQQLATAYEHSQQQHVSFDDLNNVDAVSVNGYSFSRLMTLEEYNSLAVKDSNTIYLVIDDGTETPTKTLSSISAVYNQGSTAVYPSTNLDSLKNNLTVTATYSDNSNSVISSGYSLSGNLTVGTSTITVTYSGKTTTFNVTVSEETTPTKTLSSITAVYTQGDAIVYPSTALNNLKSNLVVTANYDDDSTETVTDYTLSGELSVGASTITVTYSGKTTTFNVNVTEESTPGMDSAYSYLKVTVPASATAEQSTLYLSKPIGGTMSSLYINDVPKDVPSGSNQATTSYSLNEGENIIKIKGCFTCWNSKCNIDALQLQNDLTTCSGMFFGCPNITFNATIPSTVTNTNAMFRGSGLVNGVDIPSSVTNTASMYQSVGTLITPSIVPDTVTLCGSMYGGCVSLQGTVNVPNSATDISSFLNSAGTNGEGISVTGINTLSVTNYNLAFFNAKITTIEQSFADLIKQPKPATVTKSICFRASDTNLSSPITIAEVHSDWKQ